MPSKQAPLFPRDAAQPSEHRWQRILLTDLQKLNYHFKAFFGITYALGLFCLVQKVYPSPLISFKFAAAASSAASYPTQSDTINSHPITHNDIHPKNRIFNYDPPRCMNYIFETAIDC